MKKISFAILFLILLGSFVKAYSGLIVCPNSGKKCTYEKTVDGVTYTVESEYKGLFKVIPAYR